MPKKNILERLIREDIDLLDQLVGWWLETGRSWNAAAAGPGAWGDLVFTGLVEIDPHDPVCVRPTKYGMQWIRNHRIRLPAETIAAEA